MKQTALRWRTASLAVAILMTLTTALSPRVTAADPRPEGESPGTPANPAVATSAAAPAKTKPRDSYPFRGRIAALDATAKTLTLEGKGIPRRVQLTDQTRILRDGSAIALQDLKAGEQVGGTLRKSSGGLEEALLVRIVPRKEAGSGEAKRERRRSRGVAKAEPVEHEDP